jgi:hypothetical protein
MNLKNFVDLRAVKLSLFKVLAHSIVRKVTRNPSKITDLKYELSGILGKF